MNVLQGFGFGLGYTPMAVLAFCTLQDRLMVEGSALFNVMRHFGSVVFISFSILVLTHGTHSSYSDLRDWISPFNELFNMSSVVGAWSHGTQSGLAVLNNEVLRQATMIGYINAFYLFAITATLTVPLALLFRSPVKSQD